MLEQKSNAGAAQDPVADSHTSYPSLEGRKAIITGGTTGIGRDPRYLEEALEPIGKVGGGSGVSVEGLAPSLRQLRRCAVSHMRVETRLEQP